MASMSRLEMKGSHCDLPGASLRAEPLGSIPGSPLRQACPFGLGWGGTQPTTCTWCHPHFPLTSGPPSDGTSSCPVKYDAEGNHPLKAQLESHLWPPPQHCHPSPGPYHLHSPRVFRPVSVSVSEILPPLFNACGISGFGNEDKVAHTLFKTLLPFLSLHSLSTRCPSQETPLSTASHCPA